jgi:dihydrofolate synthase/folylpolyglutamate synthase
VAEAMAAIRLDGRFQRIGSGWVLDVAHNPAAAEILAAQIESLQCQGRTIAIVGMLADKDVAGYIEPLSHVVDDFIAVTIEASRGATAQSVAQEIANSTGQSCRVIDTVEDALIAAQAAATGEDLILVTGSFYIVGPALQWIERNCAETSADLQIR